jgi:hypothetical protein
VDQYSNIVQNLDDNWFRYFKVSLSYPRLYSWDNNLINVDLTKLSENEFKLSCMVQMRFVVFLANWYQLGYRLNRLGGWIMPWVHTYSSGIVLLLDLWTIFNHRFTADHLRHFLISKVKAAFFTLCKMKVLFFCRFSAQRKKGKDRNRKAIKPRSCWQNMEEHTWPPPLLCHWSLLLFVMYSSMLE